MSYDRRKSDRREMTYSSDENISGKFYSDTYSHKSSGTEKKERNKKTKKSIKNQSESSSESDDYDSRKENKSARKYKKKSLKEKYEEKSHKSTKEKYEEKSHKRTKEKCENFDKKYESKHLENSHKNKYHNNFEKQERKSDKMYDDDMSPRMDTYNSKKSRKRSKSQERQRYGKWADAIGGNKDSKWKDDETEERRSKRFKENKYSDDYRKDINKNSDYESDENSQSISRRDYVSKNYKSYKSNRKDISSDNYRNKDMYETGDKDRSRNFKTQSQHDETDTSLNKYQKNKYDLTEENRESSHIERYSRKKISQSYVDLDDPNQNKESAFNESDPSDNAAVAKDTKKNDDIEPLSKRDKIGNINTRTGGAYIPPAKLRMMQEKIKDKNSEEYQRLAWEALKKSIVGMTNKVNSSNIAEIVQDLFKENIIRGRGVLVRAIMQAQGASPTFTRVYAALVSIINTKFPEIGELILKRLIIQYKRGFRRNDKTVCMTAARFLAHLLNQEVAHEVLILEIVTHLLEKPSEDSVEVAIATLKECGKKLTQLSPRGMRAITQSVRNVLHEGSVDPRVRYMIEVFFAVQKDGFKDFEIIPPELDLVEDEDKYTHLINLDDAVDAQEMLNIFKFDPNYLENEEKYKSVVKEILGDSDEEGSAVESGSEGEGDDDEEDEEKKEENQQIVDMTETNIVCLRRKIYLTIQSSLDFEECAHKLLKLELKPGQILEMCYMILDCCAQQRTYEKFFGLLAQRFCQLNKVYVEPFTQIFENSYKTIHRLETNKLRNVAKFFAHLLYTDAISWEVLSIIKLNEEDTTSSSRIFIKILFQELCEYMGLTKLNERVKDVTLQEAFDGLFPRDHPHNTRFAINFFTSIGLGGLTDELREHLKNLPKTPVIPVVAEEKVSSSSSSSSSSSDSSSESN